jgi:hypothetical protein
MLWLQTRCLELVRTPKRKLWIAANGTTKAVSRFGSRPAVWSLSLRQNVSFGLLRVARLLGQLPASAPDPLSGACPHAKT